MLRHLLQGDEHSTLQQLKDCLQAINKISKFLHGHENLSCRIESAYIEIKDIAREIEAPE